VTTVDEVMRVGIAECAVASLPWKLRTMGLGSCVGIVLYDPIAKVAGLAHAMLPQAPYQSLVEHAKYADSAVPWLIAELQKKGALASRLQAKIAGGAQMFAFTAKTDIMRVGPRNVESVLTTLGIHKIPVLAQDVGGNVGRTIEFDIATERMSIRTAMHGTYEI